jgi:hypothetical protein
LPLIFKDCGEVGSERKSFGYACLVGSTELFVYQEKIKISLLTFFPEIFLASSIAKV